MNILKEDLPGDHVPSASGVGTARALVRLLARVRPLVGGQVIRPAEHLSAHPTRVRLDACVEPHVPGQHVAACKAPFANVTEIGFAAGVAGFGLVSAGHVLR